MCGIAGFLALDRSKVLNSNILVAMTQAVSHRGPDDEGFLLGLGSGLKSYSGTASCKAVKELYPMVDSDASASLGLGFRRLSILDLSASAHQPMSLKENGLHIVFNGEIYNWKELRQDLSEYQFHSSSDTEVILYAYLKWGKACVSRFIGMWSFAIWDAKNEELFCSRDRYGIKPFYYAVQDAIFYFGSEIKQVLICPIDKTLNQAMILRSMKINAMLVYGNETFWANVKSLKAGENLIIKAGQIRIERYYQLQVESFESANIGFEEAVQQYRELFLDSIRLQMRADVEIGTCLSGGMDSTAIVCIAPQHTDIKMKTFSSYFDADPALDERRWIKLVKDQTSSESFLVSPKAKDAWEWFQDLTRHNDLPLGAGFAAQYAVMKQAKETGVKVLLNGQGSDEISAGYAHGYYRYFADLLRTFQFSSAWRDMKKTYAEASVLQIVQAVLKTLLTSFLSESALYHLEYKYYRFNPFSQDFMDKAIPSEGAWLTEIKDIHSSKLSNFLFNLMSTTSLGTLLHYEDRMSMANSVESRVPFLDHRLVDFTFSLPSKYKTKAPYNKYVHRMAMKDIIPTEIFERKDKSIFSSPFHNQWLKRELKPMVNELFHSPSFRHRGIWNLSQIHQKWEAYQKGNTRPAEMIFNIIALEMWFRTWEKK